MKHPAPHSAAVHAVAHYTASLSLCLLLTALFCSCSFITDDRSDCPVCQNPLHVTFRYDYNAQQADMFRDHVGSLTCYVVNDTDNRIVAMSRASNSTASQPLRAAGFAFNFEDLPQGDYRLYALATQQLLSVNTLNYEVPLLDIGDDITTLTMSVPHTSAADADGRYAVPSNHPLDTLWHAMSAQPVHVDPSQPAFEELSLVRDTKNLSVMLMQTQNPADCQDTDYDLRVLDSNAQLGYDNSLAEAQPLVYKPYAQWTTETLTDAPASGTASADSDDSNDVTLRTAHYDLSLSRLFAYDDATRNARLVLTNRHDGKTILNIDLIHYLALLRNAAELSWSLQEFLDRQYDYRLDVILSGNEWQYITISINATKWSLRIQNERL